MMASITETATGSEALGSNITPPSDLSDIIMSHLLSSNKVEGLQASLFNSLATVGWAERVRKLAFELFRSGQHNNFEDVVEKIVRMATTKADESTATSSADALGKRKRDDKDDGQDSKFANGNDKVKRARNGSLGDHDEASKQDHRKLKIDEGSQQNGSKSNGGTADFPAEFDVRIPEQVVNHGANYLQEVMHEVLASDDEGKNTDEDDSHDDDDDDNGGGIEENGVRNGHHESNGDI